MTLQRLEDVGIVVDDLAAATAFFVELGLKVLGEAPVEGDWVDCVAFSVDDIDVAVAGLQSRGEELIGEVVRYEDSYGRQRRRAANGCASTRSFSAETSVGLRSANRGCDLRSRSSRSSLIAWPVRSFDSHMYVRSRLKRPRR